MLSIVKPSRHKIEAFICTQLDKPYSYSKVGYTQNETLSQDHPLSRRYRIIHHRFPLGNVTRSYESAKRGFQRWSMFDLGRTHIHSPSTLVEKGLLMGVVSHVMTIWSINVGWIIYIIDEDSPVVRFGFGYGTLSWRVI